MNMKLRVYDGVAAGAFLMLPALFATALSTLAAQNGSAGWLALLVAFGAAGALFLLCTRLLARYPGQGLPGIAAQVAGRPAATVCSLALGAYFCLFTGVQIREYAEILKIYALPLTPLWAVAGLILLCALLLCACGQRAVIKTAGFFFVLLMLGLAMVLLLGITRYDAHRLVPVLGSGLPTVLQNGLRSASLFSGVLGLLLIAPAFGSTKGLTKAGIIALLVSAVSFILLFLGCICMFSAPIAAQMVSGFMEMGKSSYFNHFFYRFESVLLFFLIFGAAMQAALGLVIARESVGRALGLQPGRGLSLLCALVAAVAMLPPRGMHTVTQLYLPLLRRYSLLLLAGIPLLILLVSTVKRALGYEKN